ncbi:hypothetical protein KHX94_02720 [Shewanella dokdonensis]|uniref:SGNH hydrolase-type esterase domain-containing protein n=1 Tax=Shewanella dokdonensis TaxID=712036 RepID=A0ABX8DG52_9GAMM|nr:hypothetical protein [Shewanella dokdonensis]QVK23655.1 hypothetical protein KHX94_02720 [Shewanella dokdonensis]
MWIRSWGRNLLLMSLGIILALLAGEGVVRVATMDQQNYVIEMWRYAKLLKEKSPDPEIGHQHLPNHSATLQNVIIQTNEFGMRGPRPDSHAQHRVAIVGDSIALGWGISDQQSLRGQLAQRLPEKFDVVNAGVGNMNMAQSVKLWSKINQKIKADTLIVLVTPRATAKVITQEPGWFVKHSELAALALTFIKQLMSGEFGEQALLHGYQQQWQSEAGQAILTSAFNQLKHITQVHNARVIIASVPEMHDFNHYQFGFMEQETKRYAEQYGFTYIDLLPCYKALLLHHFGFHLKISI